LGKGEIFGGLSNNIEIKNYHKNDARTLFEEKKLILFSDREKKSQQFFNAHFLKKKYFSKLTFFILKILDNFSEGGVKK